MEEVVLVIHLILALAIIGLVLLQRSEGGGLGIGSSGGMGAFASARTTANVLTRATGICAMCFFVTSLILGILTGQQSRHSSIMDKLDTSVPAATAPATPGTIGYKPSTDTGSVPAAVPSKNDAAPAQKTESKPEKKPAKAKPVAPVSQ